MKNKDAWSGKYYKGHSNPQFKSALKIIDSIQFNGNESILDVGCGDGKISAELANQVPKGSVIGTDVSTSMIKQAQQDYSYIENLSFQCVDATEISFKDQFDYVLSFATFHWIQDQQKALNNIYEALKSGGKTIIKCGCNTQSALSDAFDTVCNQPAWKERFKKHSQQYQGKTSELYLTIYEAVDILVTLDPHQLCPYHQGRIEGIPHEVLIDEIERGERGI